MVGWQAYFSRPGDVLKLQVWKRTSSTIDVMHTYELLGQIHIDSGLFKPGIVRQFLSRPNQIHIPPNMSVTIGLEIEGLCPIPFDKIADRQCKLLFADDWYMLLKGRLQKNKEVEFFQGFVDSECRLYSFQIIVSPTSMW